MTKVLIARPIEDEEMKSMTSICPELANCEITLVNSFEDAMKEIRETFFDLIISSIKFGSGIAQAASESGSKVFIDSKFGRLPNDGVPIGIPVIDSMSYGVSAIILGLLELDAVEESDSEKIVS